MAKNKDDKKDNKTDDQVLQPNQSLTPEQQAIFNRASAETAEWETIREDQITDYSLSVSPLDLKQNFPEAWKKQVEKIYAFRWCERTDKRIDELTRGGSPITRWKICTRITTPFMAHYIDKMLGCVARLDQILLHRPWDRHMIERDAQTRLTEAHADSGQPERRALRSEPEHVEAYSGPEYKIGAKDEVQYEDAREGIEDLIVEE